MNLKIREAAPKDLSGIVETAESAFGLEYKKFTLSSNMDYFKGHRINPHNGLYVAHTESGVAGYSLFIPLMRTGTLELVQMGVRKEWQGQGIGSQLLPESIDQYVQKIKDLDGEPYAIYLTVSEDNPVAQKLYKKYGFEEVGRMRDMFVGKGNIEIIMGKILQPSRIYPKNTLWVKEK